MKVQSGRYNIEIGRTNSTMFLAFSKITRSGILVEFMCCFDHEICIHIAFAFDHKIRIILPALIFIKH